MSSKLPGIGRYDSDNESLLSDDSDSNVEMEKNVQAKDDKTKAKEKKIHQSILASFFNAAERSEKARPRSIRTLPPPKKKAKTLSIANSLKPPPVGKKTSQVKTYNEKEKVGKKSRNSTKLGTCKRTVSHSS
mmetsp:Transcript_18796/g.23647  ORF Transcript_18796/g.23647 Transcript_18796/m.23647 type:complete len:132 (+) Transcript_18796:85-480(+)